MVLAALQHLALLREVKRNGYIRAAKEKVGGVRGVSSFLRLAHQTVFLFSKLEVEHASESAAKAKIPCLLKMYCTTDRLTGCALPPCKATAQGVQWDPGALQGTGRALRGAAGPALSPALAPLSADHSATLDCLWHVSCRMLMSQVITCHLWMMGLQGLACRPQNASSLTAINA